MLPRVGAALAQFISPIDSSTSKTKTPRREREANPRFERSKPEKEKPAKARVLKAVPKPSEQAPTDAAAPSPPGTPSVAAAFLELFNFLQTRKNTFLMFIGRQAYREAAREQKKAGRFRKGTMLDRKAG